MQEVWETAQGSMSGWDDSLLQMWAGGTHGSGVKSSPVWDLGVAQALVRIMQFVRSVVSHTGEYVGLGRTPVSDVVRRGIWLENVQEQSRWLSPNRQLLVV